MTETAPLIDQRNKRWDEPFGDEPLDDGTIARILALPAFEPVSSSEFPTWLPLEKVIANDGRLCRFRLGETILHKGDYGNSLFIILEGDVAGLAATSSDGQDGKKKTNNKKSWGSSILQLLRRPKAPEYRKSRNTAEIREAVQSDLVIDPSSLNQQEVDELTTNPLAFSLSAPQMFGELSALTRSARTSTIYSTSDDTLLFELRWQGLREIRDWSEPFREHIDALYHERGLFTRLQECPVFAHLSHDALTEIADACLFETYGKFDWNHRFKSNAENQQSYEDTADQEPLICEQGHYVDGLLLINFGFARVSENIDKGERTIAHLARNDTFGLREIADQTSNSTSNALNYSLRAIGYVDVIRVPTALVKEFVLPGLPHHFLEPEDASLQDKLGIDMRQSIMDFVVDRRLINGEHAMVINTDRCVGCDDCVKACAMAHDNNPRFVRHGHRFETAMFANACMHCTDPVCLIGCPTGAIHRAENSGAVVIDDNTCIGCATCANSCPYNNIRMVDIRDKTGEFLKDSEGRTISRATKCDLCFDQLTGPACAEACPHDALIRLNIRDTGKLLSWIQ